MSDLNKTVARRVAEEMLSGKPELAPELFDASLVKPQTTLAQILHAAFPDLSLRDGSRPEHIADHCSEFHRPTSASPGPG
jgi:hypothetical protein